MGNTRQLKISWTKTKAESYPGCFKSQCASCGHVFNKGEPLLVRTEEVSIFRGDDEVSFYHLYCDPRNKQPEKLLLSELLEALKLMLLAWEAMLPSLKQGVVQDYELVLTKAPVACRKAIQRAERAINEAR